MKKSMKNKKRKNSDFMNIILEREAAINDHDKFRLIPHTKLILVAILVFIVTDGVFIHQLVREYAYQAAWESVLCAVTFAIIVDTVPTIIANLLKVPEKGKAHYVGIIALCAAELAVFIAIFALRWCSQDVLYGIKSTQLSLLSDSVQGVSKEAEFTAAQSFMTILLGIEPVATSILSFCLGYFEEGKTDKEHTKRMMDFLVKAELANVDANNLELQNEQNRDLVTYDNALKDLEHDNLKQQEYIAKEYVKMQLAMAQGTPEALSNMMEAVAGEQEAGYAGSVTEGI